MSQRPFNVAIETSGRVGSLTLGREAQLLETVQLPPQERHRVDLLPVLDELTRRHGVRPGDVGEWYVSVGPGSFTGLRIGIATVKTIARMLPGAGAGVWVVAVPTIEVVAAQVDPVRLATRPGAVAGQGAAVPWLAVALNLKKGTVYGQLFTWRAGAEGGAWVGVAPAHVATLPELLAQAPAGTRGVVVGQALTAEDMPAGGAAQWELLSPDLAQGRSDTVWRLGRVLAAAGQFTDPMTLAPLYGRPPEAVTLWEQREQRSTSR